MVRHQDHADAGLRQFAQNAAQLVLRGHVEVELGSSSSAPWDRAPARGR